MDRKLRRLAGLLAAAAIIAVTLAACDSGPSPDERACQIYNNWDNRWSDIGPHPKISEINEAVYQAQRGSDTNLAADLLNLQSTVREFGEPVGIFRQGSKKEFDSSQVEDATANVSSDCVADGFGGF